MFPQFRQTLESLGSLIGAHPALEAQTGNRQLLRIVTVILNDGIG